MKTKIKGTILFDEHRYMDGVGIVIRTKAIMLPQESLVIILVWLKFSSDSALPLEPRKRLEFMTNEALAIRMAIQDSDELANALQPTTDLGIALREYVKYRNGDESVETARSFANALDVLRTQWSNLA